MEREEFLKRLAHLRDVINGAIALAEGPDVIPSPVPGQAPDITRPDYGRLGAQLDLLQEIACELWRLRQDVLR